MRWVAGRHGWWEIVDSDGHLIALACTDGAWGAFAATYQRGHADPPTLEAAQAAAEAALWARTAEGLVER